MLNLAIKREVNEDIRELATQINIFNLRHTYTVTYRMVKRHILSWTRELFRDIFIHQPIKIASTFTKLYISFMHFS